MISTESMPSSDEMIGEALVLRGWGWCPFPVDSCKKPLVRWKPLQRHRPNDRDLARMFRLPGVGGIAVVTGPASGGLVNRDFDEETSYHRWAADHPRLAATAPTIRTRRGYRVCVRSRSAVYRKFDDGELIGDDRHYVVMPPSRHPSGASYEWVGGPPLGLSEFPVVDPVTAGFIEAYPPAKEKQSKASLDALCPVRGDIPLTEVIREAVLRTLPHRAGERNAKLFALARSLRDHVPHDAPPGLLYDAVQHWWQMALPVINTKDFATTLSDFRRAWADVRVPMCVSRPLRVMADAASSEASPRAKLEAACRAAAGETGGAFHMSVRVAGSVAGVSKSWGAKLLSELVDTGFLRVTSPSRPSPTKRIATWYSVAG